jgi:hypothetical protein
MPAADSFCMKSMMRDGDARASGRLTQFVFQVSTSRYVARECVRWPQAISIRARPDFFVVIHHIACDLHCALRMAEKVEVGPADGSEKRDAVYLDGIPPGLQPRRALASAASFIRPA